MRIDVSSDDGLIPLAINGKEVKIDPWLLFDELNEAILAEDIASTADALKRGNAVLAKYDLPPVQFRTLGQIRVKLVEVMEEIKKKDGWGSSRSTTPSSSNTTESTSSTSPLVNGDSSGLPTPPSAPATDSGSPSAV